MRLEQRHIRAVVILCVAVLGATAGCSQTRKEAVNALNRGIEAHRSGQHDLAIDWLDKAIALESDFAEAHYTRGFVLALGKKDCMRAIDSFRAATEFEPNHAEAWYQLGKCHQDGDVEDEAVASFRKAVDSNRRHAASLYELGRLSVDRGALSEADT